MTTNHRRYIETDVQRVARLHAQAHRAETARIALLLARDARLALLKRAAEKRARKRTARLDTLVLPLTPEAPR